jgi:hypothetical protein
MHAYRFAVARGLHAYALFGGARGARARGGRAPRSAQLAIAALLLLRWGYKLLLLRAGLHITAASQHHEARFNISLPSVATITASPPADGDGAGSRGGGRGQVAARLGGCAPDEALQWIPGCEQGAAPHALLPTAVRRRPQDRPYHVVVGHI